MEELTKKVERAYRCVKLYATSPRSSFFETAKIVPHVNQILLAPGCDQEDLVTYCQERDIPLEAYSPLGYR